MEEESAKIGTAVEHSRDNKYFVEFTEAQKKLLAKNPNALGGADPEDDGLFLAYMTKRYFKDNIWLNLFRAAAGIVCIIIARILISRGVAFPLNILSIAIFAIGVIAAPAGIFFLFSNLSCYRHYNDYVTSRNDPFTDKIIKFYNDSRKK